jgi:hypothetical protein
VPPPTPTTRRRPSSSCSAETTTSRRSARSSSIASGAARAPHARSGHAARVAPGLADIIFGRFAQSDWPQRFINGGQEVDWPKSAAWAMRIVTDAKLRRLVARLLRARADGQKVIVFSQFTDTLAYLDSVLRRRRALERRSGTLARGLLGPTSGTPGRRKTCSPSSTARRRQRRDRGPRRGHPRLRALLPPRPVAPAPRAALRLRTAAARRAVANGWTQALKQPTDVLFATDVLAEGVNLQDAALLINFDVHWNPVRMIQRAGRIDRRLNPAIEEATSFPDLEALARDLGVRRRATGGTRTPAPRPSP